MHALYRFFAATLFAFFVASDAAAQVASPQCVACRQTCVKARVASNDTCCSQNGGQPAPASCKNPSNPNGYAQCLTQVANVESNCWDQCSKTYSNCK